MNAYCHFVCVEPVNVRDRRNSGAPKGKKITVEIYQKNVGCFDLLEVVQWQGFKRPKAA